jgi:hypothetical protein
MTSTSDKRKNKLRNIQNTYNKIEDEKLAEFLAYNGFFESSGDSDKGSKKRKNKEVDDADKNAFMDEMFSMLVDYVYDSYLLSDNVERSHKEVEDRPTLFDLLCMGPLAYNSMDKDLEAEGEKENETKIVEKTRYLPSKMDIKRFAGLGGAVEMSQDAKEVLSVLVRMNESSQIQKASALALSNHGRLTMMQRDLVLGHKIAGYDTVSV